MSKIVWSGKTTSYHHKWHDTPNPPDVKLINGFRKVWFLDAQWSDCPIEVENEVRHLWRMLEMGNDRYIFKTTISDLQEIVENEAEAETWDETASEWVQAKIRTDAIIQWVREKEPTIKDDEQILIHWWW